MRNAEYRCGMGIGLGLELGSGVRVRVMTIGLRLGSGLGLIFAVVLRFSQFTHSALCRCGMGMALRLGSVVRVRVRIMVSLKVEVIIWFCRSIVLFPLFYAFRPYIPHSTLYPYPLQYAYSVSL